MNEIRTEENLERVDRPSEELTKALAEVGENPANWATEIPAEELVFVQDASDYGI